jgi:hypothetical protein
MNQSEVKKIMSILSIHPLVSEIFEGDGVTNGEVGEIYLNTTEDPDDCDAHTFDLLLDQLGLDWQANDCEGCYNEYVIR